MRMFTFFNFSRFEWNQKHKKKTELHSDPWPRVNSFQLFSIFLVSILFIFQIFSNLFKSFQIVSNLFKSFQISPNIFKSSQFFQILVNSCLIWRKIHQFCGHIVDTTNFLDKLWIPLILWTNKVWIPPISRKHCSASSVVNVQFFRGIQNFLIIFTRQEQQQQQSFFKDLWAKLTVKKKTSILKNPTLRVSLESKSKWGSRGSYEFISVIFVKTWQKYFKWSF